MAWTGKAIGAAVGSFLGPAGAIAGVWLGDHYDKYADEQSIQQSNQEFQNCLAILALGVGAAYANGSVHPNEQKRLIRFGREVFGNFPGSKVEELIVDISLQRPTVEQCAEIFRSITPEFKRIIVREILSILYADGKLERSEFDWVNKLITLAGESGDIWNEVSLYFERGTPGQEERSQHLQTLGLPVGSDAETIKKAYRQLAVQYHPDKLQSVPEAIRKLAEDKLRELNHAHESLTRIEREEKSLAGFVGQCARDDWRMAEFLMEGSVVFCALCLQANRLPKCESFKAARCGSCYGLLLFPSDPAPNGGKG